jgi:hypothetical protein
MALSWIGGGGGGWGLTWPLMIAAMARYHAV